MPDTLRDLVVSLSLQTDNFTRNIRSVNKQIQEAESFFKLAAAGVDNLDKSTAGLATHVSSLQQKLALQKEVVDQYSKALTDARDKLTDCFTRQADYANRLADAQNRQTALNNAVVSAALVFENYRITLGDSDQATIAAGQHLAQLQQSYQATSAEVQRLAGQCEALKKATQNAADAVSTGNVNLNKASAAVKTTEEAEDPKSAKQRVRHLVNDLKAVLHSIDQDEVLFRQGSRLAVRPELLDCDYYRMLSGDMAAVNRFRGQYMEQYSWAELTKGSLYFRNGNL